MTLRVAMPIAHNDNADAYRLWYPAGTPLFRVSEYFNQAGCEGIRLSKDPIFVDDFGEFVDLTAMTDGFVSIQGTSLVLRLPRELKGLHRRFNSGAWFLELDPRGPPLRHIVYDYHLAPDAAATVRSSLSTILQDAAHPSRSIVKVLAPGAAQPVSLGAFLAARPTNIDVVLNQFMGGTIELFVQAGEVIGNLETGTIELRFVDSCANPITTPAPPGGRPLNPAYYLSLIRTARNTTAAAAGTPAVTHLTAFTAAVPDPPLTTHPLYFLFEPAQVLGAGAPVECAVDLAAAVPSKPLQVTVPVQNPAGAAIAGRGIPMRGLGAFHQSRNAANPFSTPAPVRWRLVGNEPADTTAAEFGRFVTEVRPGQANRLPGPGPFDHRFTPAATHTNRVTVYWSRYGHVFSAVADAFELPVEILIATACTETGTGGWYNATFASSHEMDVIRMEPLRRQPSVISGNPAQVTMLTNYMNATGGVGGTGANANLPVPWSAGPRVIAGNPLTWGNLRSLIATFRDDVRVSPGIMQSLVASAKEDMDWGGQFYGAGYIHGLSIVHNGVGLLADDPPAGLDALFSDWFGVAVDAGGANTGVTANVDPDLTKMKRALHDIAAGAAHIKRRYNTVQGGGPGKPRWNGLSDFDLPTSFSWFNDGGMGTAAAAPGATDDHKWHRLFALTYFGTGYPRMAPRYYNAAINLLNTHAALNPQPSVRLWTG